MDFCLVVGATWKWKTTDNENYTSGSTETITGTMVLDGKENYVISDNDGDNTYIRFASNIVYMYMENMLTAKALTQSAVFEGKDVPMFDFNKSAGKTCEYTETQEATYYTIPGGATGGDPNSGG